MEDVLAAKSTTNASIHIGIANVATRNGGMDHRGPTAVDGNVARRAEDDVTGREHRLVVGEVAVLPVAA